ncbi:MAG TPA: carboxypeptidase-like regulatory domain-containing protein [Chitinophagales bacterium]|nr:carboxypeptidase-like regulatory domain-containing protein [Chitinophagales bacterium]
MKQLLWVLMLLAAITAGAQDNIVLRGYIKDKDSHEPLSLAAAQIMNSQLGALSDDNGYFELPIPKVNLNDSLHVSFIGYQPQNLSIKNYKAGDTLRIMLGTEVLTKQEAVIVATNARGVLLKAIDNLKKNLYTDSLIATGFYRQYHKENGKFVRLLEADVSVAFNVKNPYRYEFHELVQVNKQRRTENYERNVDANNHGDHLVDLLEQNPFSYNKRTFLNARNLDFFSPKFEEEDTDHYIIKTQYKEPSSKTLDRARIWVDKGSYAITRIEIEKFPNPYYVRTQYEKESIWKLVNETDVIELASINGKFFVSTLLRTYNHHVVDLKTGEVQFIVEETFQLYFNRFDTEKVGATINAGKFQNGTNLYTANYNYEPGFWGAYKPLQEHPIPDPIRKDLEHAKSLETQFEESGK